MAKHKKPTPEYDSQRETRVLLEQMNKSICLIAEQQGAMKQEIVGEIKSEIDIVKSELDTVKIAVMENSKGIKENSRGIKENSVKIDRVEKSVKENSAKIDRVEQKLDNRFKQSRTKVYEAGRKSRHLI